MSKVLVHLYSYKEKNLADFIDVLRSKSSKNNEIDFYVSDQNNLTRLKYFIGKDIFYSVIWWDELISPIFHHAKCISDNSNKKYDYVLLLDREVNVPQDWDRYLINSLPNNAVLSGIGDISLDIKNNFYIDKNQIDTDQIVDTSFINHSLIFGRYQDLANIEWPIQLKHHGVDEYLSIDLLNKDISILSLPSNLFSFISPALDKRGYVPFSLNHNYNDVLSIILNNRSEKLKYQNPEIFIEKNKIEKEKLYKLPFDFNDIEYDRSSPLDLVGGKRYIEKLNSVS